MIKMILALVVLVFLGFGDTAKAYLLVEDIPNLSTNVDIFRSHKCSAANIPVPRRKTCCYNCRWCEH